MISELNTFNCFGIPSCAGSRSAPVGTTSKMAFLNNYKRLRRISTRSRLGADPQPCNCIPLLRAKPAIIAQKGVAKFSHRSPTDRYGSIA